VSDATFGPATVGVSWRSTVQLPWAASGLPLQPSPPFMPISPLLVPSRASPIGPVAVPPVFEIVTVVLPVAPTATVPKSGAVGLIASAPGARPVPLSCACVVGLPPGPVTARVACLAPDDLGGQ